jgi:multiple sugar transport system ATP-binding protein
VARIQSRLNTTTVYVTHDQTEAMTLGDRVAVMRGGVLQQVGSPMELYNNPTNLFVAGFIGSPGMNFLPARIEGGVAKLPMVDVKLPQELRDRVGRAEGKRLIAGIRPEDFEDAGVVAAEVKPQGQVFQAELDLVEAMGAEYYAHFGVGGGDVESADLQDLRDDAGGGAEHTSEGESVVVARLAPTSRVRVGQQAELWLDATKLHFFEADTGTSLTQH